MLKLYAHQQKVVDANKPKILLVHDTGTGKSITAIALVKKNNASPLIICPKSIKQQWLDYALAHNLNNATVVTKEEFKKKVKTLPKHDCLIWDEAHYASNRTSQISKATMAYIKRHKPTYRYFLTASPYTSSPWQIYRLAEFLDVKWPYMLFKQTFFYDVRMGMRTVSLIRSGIEDKIARCVRNIGSVVKLQECVDVPEQIFETEYFDLTAEQKSAIKEIQQTESNHIVKWTATHQVCGGTKKSDGYVEDKFIKCEKLSRVKELVEQHKKLVIVCRYNLEVDMIAKAIGENVYKITGQVKNRHEVVQQAEASEVAYLVVNAACSEGYELPSFPVMVFYSYDFSLKNYLQMIGRIQRLNHIKKNVYLSLVVKGTIDEDVKKCIELKKDFDLAIYNK